MRRCEFCGGGYDPKTVAQKFCSTACQYYASMRRSTSIARAKTRANDFMARTDPRVARALALFRWPQLRTPEEQEALERWLDERIAKGIAAWVAEDRQRRGA